MKVFRLLLALAPAFCPFSPAWAWEEHKVLEYIMVHNPLLRAYRVVTNEFTPALPVGELCGRAMADSVGVS